VYSGKLATALNMSTSPLRLAAVVFFCIKYSDAAVVLFHKAGKEGRRDGGERMCGIGNIRC